VYISIITALIAVMLVVGIPSTTFASDINCEEEPNDEYCTGEEGAGGMAFCDVVGAERGDDCYDRDFSGIDCGEHPDHSRCTGFQGRDGLIFCDVQYQDVGYKENCYDRNDNPSEYCDSYAVEESSKEWTAEFCQTVCSNYQDVLAKGELCD
jgi:hypothetical protein